MSIPAEAVEAAAKASHASRWPNAPWDALNDDARTYARENARLALEAAAPHMLAPALALHPKTCEINGGACAWEDGCPVLVCGPCGEAWPCPTVKALTE